MGRYCVSCLMLTLTLAVASGQNCDFDAGLSSCNYQQSRSDTFDWTRIQGPTGSSGTGPANDHTCTSRTTGGNANGAPCVFPFTYRRRRYSNCINIAHTQYWCATTSNYDTDSKWGNCGYYMYIETSSPRRQGDKAFLFSKSISAGQKCLKFFYHMYGPHVDTLNVYATSNTSNFGTTLWSKRGSQGNQWKPANVSLSLTQASQVVFEGIRGSSYQGDISIDDVEVANGPCSVVPGVCTFESDVCGFVQEKNTDQFDWIRQRGRTLSSGTGPSSDHTKGTSAGYYMYVEASSPRRQGDKSQMSKQYSGLSSTGNCLTFWYHMFGFHIGRLNVYVKQSTSDALPSKAAWAMIGRQGNQWVKGQLTVANASAVVVFEGVIGRGYQGDIAIDDISVAPGKCVSSSGDCDFQRGFCTWYNSRIGDNFDWITGSGGTPSSFTGPSSDRKGNRNGKYIFIETSVPRKVGDKALLMSPLFNKTSSDGKCFTFWYHMYGLSIGTLNIYVNVTRATTGKQLVWTLSGNKGNRWFNGQVKVGTTIGTYQVIIEGIRGNSYTGDIAIDDFEFKDGNCSTVPSNAGPGVSTTARPTTPITVPTPTTKQSFDCDFEQSICSPWWSQDRVTDDMDWTRQRGSTSSVGTGPTTDHTKKTRFGYYIYVEVSGQRANKTARLISQDIPGTTAIRGRCLRFWYHMYGPHVNALNVYVKTGNNLGSTVWSKAGTQGNQWNPAWVTLHARSHFKIVLEGLTGSGYRGDIAIDDITLRPGPCPPPSTTCTFEDAADCGYTHSDGVEFKWTKGSGSTTSVGTGPRTDHTTNSSAGFYMYTEASSPRRQGDKAQLISPTNPATAGSCLEFWYHMYGADVGQLNIYVRTGNVIPRTALWGESGNKGNEWKVAKVSVRANSPYELVFEGVIGNGYRGDVAIDDIKLTSGVCPSPGSCNFEKGLCTWTQERNDNFDWLRGQARTPSVYTGPATDHTTGNATGYYLFIEASSPRRPGDKARLVSEQFNNRGSTPRCFTFWYHMYGSAIGKLRVFSKIQNGRETLLWNLTGQQQPSRTSAWKYASTPMIHDTDHVIIIEGERGSSYQGDIAIDDIQITSQSCTVYPPQANPNGAVSPSPTTGFPRTLPTTFPPGPFNCNFESGFCQYTQDSTDRFNWTRFQGYTHSSGTGPSMDHTRGKGAVGPKGPGSLAHTSGKCLHVLNGAHSKPRNDQPLVTYVGCGQARLEFVLGNDGYLRHTKYNQCVRPQGARTAEGTFVGVSDNCGNDKWRILSGGILQHIPSRKCLMPYRRYANPPNNNRLIITSACTQFKQRFTWLPTMGWFAYIETSSPRRPNDTARLISNSQVTTSRQCLNFWYHMYGAHVNQLNVYLKKGNNLGRPVWSKFGTHGDMWKPAHVYMGAATNFKIVFEAIRGNGYQGDIAIDDVEVTSGCPAPKECTFEETNPALCGWTNIRGDNFDWRRATGSTASIGTGPRNDHTYGNSKGYYMYIETSGFIRNGWKAWLQSPRYPSASTSNGKCLQFWYHMYGSSIGSLNVYIQTGLSLPRTPSWTRSTDQGNQWLIGQVSITTSIPYRIVFEGIRGRSYTGDIAIDDVKMLDGVCNQPASCDFENDRCTWTNTKAEDNFDWTVTQGATPSGQTGPAADHTKRNGVGHYIYMEASSPRKSGDKTRYISERFTATQSGVNYCLKFWYHMFGSSIGTLNVLIKTAAGNSSLAEKIVWSLSGNKGKQWRFASVPITSRSGFQMVIEGIRGNGYAGDISVDDVSYTRSSCQVLPSTAVPRPPTTAPPATRPTTPAVTAYSCNFEKDLCTWQQDLTDNFNWTRHRGKTSSTDTGPSSDHTIGTVNGTYIYIEASFPRQANDKARIISAGIPADGRMGHCVKFWFHMYGPHVNALNIYLKQGNQLNGPVWKRTGNNGNKWRYGQVSVSSNVAYSVVFEGVRGTSFNGDISLDDVDITPGVCPPPTQCDFEHGTCGYAQDQTDDFDWTRRRGRTPSLFTGPSTDHTLKTSQGYYMYTEATNRQSGAKARIMTPIYTKTTPLCLEFWYHLNGAHIGTLNVYTQSTSSSGTIRSIIWTKTGNHGNQWNIARTSVSGGNGRRIVFEGIRGRGYQGDIAIDDITIKDGNCPPPGHCTFESGDFCTWTNAQTGDRFDWIIGSGGTPSFYTGPTVDHTTGTAAGSYAFIEASSPRRQGDTARLVSESFPPTSSRGRCLKFWYHMKGGDIGTLNVYTRTQNGTNRKMWTLQGQQGAVWKYGQGPIRSTVDYQVVFEAVRGNGYAGDIAIDDIEFVNFACSNLPSNSVPQVPTTPRPPTAGTTKPPTPAPSQWNCNFTKSKCSWTDDPTGKFIWRRHQGSTGSYLTGPTEDHTTGTAAGWYIYIETSLPRKPNDTARLISAPIPSTRQKCLQFWYHMYGDHVDNLTVYMKTRSGMSPVFFKRGTQGNRWRHATVDITSATLFKLVFEGVRGLSYRGDIALDDISLNDGRCPPQAECTFEDPNMCGWQNMAGDNFDWTRASGATASFGTGPANDHTYGTRIGYYMYIEASSPRSKGHRAWLRSPQFKPTAGKCLQFWYHMYGSTVGKLNILYYKNGARSRPIWTLTGNQGNQWRIAQVTLRSTTNFQIIFDGSTGASYTGDIAIDDVLIKDGACPLPGNCNFETGMCTYVNVQSGDEFDWLIGSGGTLSSNTGPPNDHTTGLRTGRYLFIESSWPRMPHERARVESEVLPGRSSGNCISFWYHMRGAHIGTLNVYMKIIGQSQSIIWSLSQAQGSSWLQGQAPLLSGGRSFQVVFEGIRGEDYQGDIAIDDIGVTDLQGSCSVLPTKAVPWGCNFEQNNCRWTQARDDNFDWRRYRGSTLSTGTGPRSDHTTGNRYGYYNYIETSSPRRPNDTARFISPVIVGNGTALTHCVKFYYHMYGPHVNTLKVYTLKSGRYSPALWLRNGTQGPNWRYGEVSVRSSDNIQVVFEGKRGTNYKGDIAIDDIDLQYGDCPSSGVCTFEAANICGWSQDQSDNFDWKRASGSTPSARTGPRFDHTYGTRFGHYMYIETSTGNQGAKARLVTPFFVNRGTKCIRFYYHMYGASIGTLNVYARFFFFRFKLWSKSGNQNNTWHLAQVEYKRSFSFQVMFEAIKGNSFTGDIAIDDFKLIDGSCPEIGDCDFESGDLCTWSNSKRDDFDWILGNGKTPSFLTGPAIDHTTGTSDGYYAFIEASSPRRPGDKALLESPTFPPTSSSGRCTSFWYHMYGSSIGTLNVRIRYLSQDGQTNIATQLIWQLKGNKGNQWLQGRIPIRSNSKYTLAFEAIRGTSYNGDIAIDDITVTQSSCSFTPSTAWPPGLTTSVPLPTTGPTRGPTAGNLGNDCNFEKNWCLWTKNATARFKWNRHRGSTASYGTGPKYDHTLGNSSGYYVYAEASYPAQANDTAWLTSGSIAPFGSGGKCLSFWYHQYGPHVGSLRVKFKVGSVQTLLWQRTGTQGDAWKRGLVQLPVSTNRANVIFEAIRGVSYAGDIALDDISFLNGQCPPPAECTFEATGAAQFCRWTQVTGSSADQFDWSIGSGSTPSVQTGPKTDHTLQTSKGKYLYIETSYPRRRGDKAQLLSATYNRPSDKCFEFWYHMFGFTIGSLRLFLKPSGSSSNNLLWSKTGNQANMWKVAQVTVRRSTQSFKLMFEGEAGSSYTGDIAVDDVKLMDGTCPLPGDCDFEKFGTCTYYQDQVEDTFDWIRGSGGTSSWRTGPTIDNTKKDSSGHYMYIEASYPRKQGDKARIISTDFNPTSSRGRCVKFAYHMYGTSIGALSIYIKTGAGNQSETLIWSNSGNHGNQWILGQAPVRSSKKYSIVFEGVVGSSYTGDIAIDDIAFTGFACNHIPANAAPPTVKPTTLTPSDSNCTFEKGLCYWRQLTTDRFDWTRYRGSTGSYGTGPLGDHTTGTGYYLYIETSFPRRPNDTAIIESPPIRPSVSKVCFTFWYHMHGAHVNQMNVYRVRGSFKQRIWSRKGTQGNKWRYAQIDILSYSTFKVQIEAIRGISYQGDISIDDIVVLDKECPAAKFCDFEDSSMCNWQNKPGDDFDWSRGDGDTPSIQTGPSTDHTLGTSLGNYLYIETSLPRRLGQKAWLYSHYIPKAPTGKCLNFWYHMYGADIGKLNIYLDRATGTPIWNRTGDQGNVWRHGRVTLKSFVRFKAIFEGVVGKSYRGDIAIDDVSIDDTPCPPPGSCNFEKSSFCTWKNIPNGNRTSQDDFDWTLNSGSTASIGTGPRVDHTLGTALGTYIYIETSGFNRRKGERARIESELFPATAGKCLSFWYHMYGSTIGTLNIYMKTNSVETLLKTYNGSQGNAWIEGEVGLHSASNFKVILEGTRGGDYTGDISLDDIYIKDNNCVGLCSSVRPTARVKCGYDGIAAGTCTVSLGCCYDDSVPNVPFCFYHPSSCLAVPVNGRRQCGYAGISRQACQNQGCCYDTNSITGVKCYHSLAATTPFPTTAPPITTPAPSPFDCTFESGLCRFTNDRADDFDWRRDKGGTPSVKTGPSSDHTLGNRNGYYVYIETSYQTHNDTANLQSPTIDFSIGGDKVCVRFWFHMYGQHVDTLNVFLQTGSRLPALPIWTKNGTHGDKWRYAQIEVPRRPAFKAVFQGKRGPGYQGDIALDDISFINGVCPPQLQCDFESSNLCGYVQDVSDDFDWTVGQANTTSWRTGPPYDHTYGTKFGHYMHIEASYPRQPGDKARLESPEHPSTVGKCVEFYYHMYGAGMGTLRVFLRRGRQLDTNPIWSLSGDQGYRWHRASITVVSQRNWKIVFEGIRGGDYRSDIAIDDIIIHNYACPPKGSCDFESGLCGYDNIADDKFDWVRHSGGTTSINTGPKTDHTTGTNLGYYMYIEASAPRKSGDRAHLVSETFKVNPQYSWCVSFWYHMFGIGSGALRLETRFKYPNYPRYYYRQFWIQRGNHGDNWLYAQATVTSSYDFQVAFEGEIGGTPSYAGDIGVDDVRVVPGKCPASTPTPSPNPCAIRCNTTNVCIPAAKICDFVADCGNNDNTDEQHCGGCDFETGVCKWSDQSKGTFDWNRQRGSTATVNTGPSKDHTKGNPLGYYMYVESSRGGAYNQAVLQSPTLRQASASCRMNFWYHMYGSGIGTLRVYVVTGTRHTILWELSGNQGNTWKQGIVYLMRRRQPYTVKIEAVRSFSTRGDIAVDDISFSNCQLPAPSQYCWTVLYFQCANRVCVPYSRLCDYTDDCGDNSDESNCPWRRYPRRCNFEWSTCFWSQLTDDQFNWTRSRGSTDSVGTGPLFDHTTGTNSGYYIYAEASYPRKKGDKARLASRNFQATRGFTPCNMRFYYHMTGAHIGSLNVYIRTCQFKGCPETLVWSRSVSVGNYWVRNNVQIRSSKAFQVIIEAVRGTSYQGDIALDDISFDDSCVPFYGTLPTPQPTTTRPPTTPPCKATEFYCRKDGKCIDAAKRCDYKKDCTDGSDEVSCGPCDFESGTCGYKDVSTGYYAWDRLKYSSNADQRYRGPVIDNTKRTADGYFMYTKRGAGSSFTAAALRSGNLPQTGANCVIQFYYYLNYTTGRLSVSFRQDGYNSFVFRTTKTTKGKWMMATTGVGARPAGWQLIFSGYRTYTAIDDVSFVNCSLPPNRGGQCGSSEVACSNGACITNNLRCDYSNDCGDKSDENPRECALYKERCGFEGNLCNWYQNQDDDFDWTRRRGTTSSVDTGPGNDHTKGTIKGYYLYIETSWPRKLNDTARLTSAPFRPAVKADNCYMRFFYHMFGDHVNALNVYMKTTQYYKSPMKVIWSKSGNQGDIWRRAEIMLQSSVNFRLVIEGTRGTSYKGDIAIDDVSFTPGCKPDFRATLSPNPKTTAPPPGCKSGEFKCNDGTCIPVSNFCNFRKDCADNSDEARCPSKCDFEKDLCGWANVQYYDRLDWTRHQGKTPSNGTGPDVDHTLNTTSGWYVYIEAGQRKSGYYPNAHLASPYYLRGSRNCKLSFWYNMWHWKRGPDTRFNVLYRKNGRDTVLWTNIYQTANKWMKATMALPSCPTDFRVILEGRQYWATQTDVAVDDIEFDCAEPQPPASCASNQFQCTTTKQCVDQNTLCDYDRNCCDGSDETPDKCKGYTSNNFEQGLGSWVQLQNDDFDWTLQSGSTGSSGTGPARDHTLQEEHGKYIYLEASSPRQENDTARLASPTIRGSAQRKRRATGDCRMRFFYHMKGSSIGELDVYIATTYGKPSKKVWHRQGNQGDQWIRGEVVLSSNADFQVIIVGIVGSSYRGDISIDDISFTPGCSFSGTRLAGQPTPPPVDPCLPAFQCRKDLICIPRSHVCDFTPDCSDGADEASSLCGYPCGFENGLCGFRNAHKDDYDWILNAGNTPSVGTGPSTDATGNKTGKYLFFEVSNRVINKRAIIVSPTYGGSFADCTLTFYYHMYGNNIGDMWVHLIDINGTTALWRLYNNQGNQWKKGVASIGRRHQLFNITFTAYVGNGYRGDIAIDQINFENCSRPAACKDATGKFQCKQTSACVSFDKVCDLTDDCGDGSDEDPNLCKPYIGCDFETFPDPCNWTQVKDDDFDWKRDRAGTPSINTGPTRDHTYGTSKGWYMYMETSGIKANSRTRMASIKMRALPGGSCKMRMFYHMYGRHVKDLMVYVRREGTTTLITKYTATGNLGDMWRKAVIDLSTETNLFTVVIEGVRGVSYQGDIAIDDITFTPDCITNGSRPVFPTLPPICGTAQFQCATDRLCIPKSKRCDKKNDCKDKSDEIGCGGGNTGRQTGNQPGTKQTGVIAAAVVGGLVLVLIVILVSYIIVKRRREKKLHLFSVFYDPTKQQGDEAGSSTKGLSIKGEEGVTNPVYDERPMGDYGMGDIDANMFADDTFTVPSDSSGGATSMANPLYQDPYTEDDDSPLSKY